MSDHSPFQVYLYDCPEDQAEAAAAALAPEEWDGKPETTVSADDPYFAEDMTCGVSYFFAGALVKAAPGASFVLWQDPGCGHFGELHAYTPALGPYYADCDSQGNPVFTSEQVLEMLASATAAGEDPTAAVNRGMGVPWLEDWDARREDHECE